MGFWKIFLTIAALAALLGWWAMSAYERGAGRRLPVTADRPAPQEPDPAPAAPAAEAEAARRERLEGLTPLQRHVTQDCGTEPPFRNAYWNNHRAGLYVDVVSGEPLFLSRDKFDSGSGWPSFTQPVEARRLVERPDYSHGMTRVEVRSREGDSHLGHVFDDGPGPEGLRYCINSAALRFIPEEEMAREGYGEYLPLLED